MRRSAKECVQESWVMDGNRLIALKLQKFRKDRRLSQEGLEALSGVPKRTIQQIESGKTSPRLDTLLVLNECGIPIGDVFNQSDEATKTKDALSLIVDVLARLESVSKSHREAVLKLLFSAPAASRSLK